MDAIPGQAGQPSMTNRRKPPESWLHVQHNAYPAYITWEQYESIQERIHQNGLHFLEQRQKAQGIEREGAGLLQGLVVCGKCGHHLQTIYRETPRYMCASPARTLHTPSTCICTSVRAPVVDHLVIEAFFQAMQPSQLDALDAVLASQRADRERIEQHWQAQLKRARYEVHLAQRQYDAVDPDNRLVAAELERRWESKLQSLHEREAAYQDFQQTPLPASVPPHLGEIFRQISQRLPDLWPILSNSQRKELLRSLIQCVIVKRPVADRIEVRIVWMSGCYTDQADRTPISRGKDMSRYAEMEARVENLYQQGLGDEAIAAQLTTEGFHSARSDKVSVSSVVQIRHAHHWHLFFGRVRGTDELGDAVTVRGLAKAVGAKKSAIYGFIQSGMIPADHVEKEPQTGAYLIRKDEGLFAQLRKRIVDNKKRNGMLKSTE